MFRKILILGVILILSAGSSVGSDAYKKYKILSNEDYLMKISFSDGQTILTLYGEKDNETLVFNKDDVDFRDDTVFVKGIPILCSRGFFSPDGLFTIEEIGKAKMDTDKSGKIEIFLTKKNKEASTFVLSRSKNKFGLSQNISVEPEEFIRGSAVSFWSNIKIEGEVNGHVIAVFGDVEIGDKAIIRGNVLAINGNVNHAKTSTVYGKIQATNVKDEHRSFKLWRLRRHKTDFSPGIKFYYNRIDGATPQFGFKYQNEESMLPEIKAFTGYGFASERWRYQIGFKQFLAKSKTVYLSGSFYKKLISGDDRIISECENTLFALLVTEDYKDYLEAEGGTISAGFKFPLNIGLEINYQIEKYKSLPSHSGLWSLFGGSKEFRPNFSSLKEYRIWTLAAMDNEELFLLGLKLNYNKKGKENYPYNSFTTANLDIEWTPKGGNDEFDFARYLITATRYQTLDRKSSLIIRAEYGNVEGDNIPTHKAFFLGGLGTLRGNDYKEYGGTEYWLGNIEFGIKFPAASWKTWVFYDVGQIANYFQNLSDTEVKNSVGIGLTFTDIIRINISKRLDRSKDSARLYVRMKHQF